MFVVRICKERQSAGQNPPHDLVERLRHLGDGRSFQIEDQRGCSLVYCISQGMSPILATSKDGCWLLALGTPHHCGKGFWAPDEAVNVWLERVVCNGLSELQSFDGIFAFVYYDVYKNQLSVFTDRTGMIPVYVSEDLENYWVSSSSTALACLRPTSFCVDALACLLVGGFLLRDLSLFSEVKRVGPGVQICYENGKVHQSKWWTPKIDLPIDASTRDLAEDVVAERLTYLRSRLTEPPIIYSTLTAGLDSRCCVALLSSLDRPITYFTCGLPDDPDVVTAQYISRQLGLDWRHHSFDVLSPNELRALIVQSALTCDGENQPFRGTAEWAYRIGDEKKVICWGIGGEIWRDYWSKHERLAPILKGVTRIERLVTYRFRGSGVPFLVIAPEFRIDFRRRVIELLEKSDGEMLSASPVDRLDMLYIMERVRRWASAHMTTMGRWTVPDFPLIGQRMVDLAYRLPEPARRNSELMRWVIWQTCRKGSEIYHNEGYSTCPVELTPLRERIHNTIIDARHVIDKLLRVAGIRRICHQRLHSSLPTYREIFDDFLDPTQMHSAFLYEISKLQEMVNPRLDDQIGRDASLNLIIGLETIARSATMLKH